MTASERIVSFGVLAIIGYYWTYIWTIVKNYEFYQHVCFNKENSIFLDWRKDSTYWSRVMHVASLFSPFLS